MTSPATYAKWAAEAKPDCGICRGMGYAYFVQQPVLTSSQLFSAAPVPIPRAYESRCTCAIKGPQA